jgi:hypothetical protein
MPRSIGVYSEPIRYRIYGVLKGKKLRFGDLDDSRLPSRPILSTYLAHGEAIGEVYHDPFTKEYSLTPKGEGELNRMAMVFAIKKQPLNFAFELDQLNPPYIFSSNMLPLPVPVQGDFGGSEEIHDMFDERLAAQEVKNVSAGRLRKILQKSATDSFVNNILWTIISQRISDLMESHRAFDTRQEADETGEKSEQGATEHKPPPLDVANILGFDLTFTMKYEGKKVVKCLRQKGELGEIGELSKFEDRIRRTLAAGILIKLASGGFRDIARVPRLISLISDGKLLDKDDARTILKAVANPYLIDLTEVTRMKEALLAVAYRYLATVGVLNLPKNTSPESLASGVASTLNWREA